MRGRGSGRQDGGLAVCRGNNLNLGGQRSLCAMPLLLSKRPFPVCLKSVNDKEQGYPVIADSWLLLLLLPAACCSPFSDPFDGSSQQGPELTLVPEAGKPAKVDMMNVYAGKVKAHARGGGHAGRGGGELVP